MQFTWSHKEDEELYRNGITIVRCKVKNKAIQKFVKALSCKLVVSVIFLYRG